MSSTFTFRLPRDTPRETVNKIRSYPSASFDSDSGTWTFNSLELQTLSDDLRSSHPMMADLLLTSPRFEDARQHVERLLDNIELSRSVEASPDFYIDQPNGFELRPFQRVGVQFAMDASRPGVLIGDQMGLGKTPQALCAVHNLGMTTGIIVCPNIVKINWFREARRWLYNQDWIQIVSSDDPDSVGQLGKGVVCITNYEALVKFKDRLKKIKWEFIIPDEAHYIKNEKVLRSKAVYEVGKRAEKRICLTGTPMSNGRPIDLWGMIHWLDKDTWPRKGDFQHRYCGPEPDYWAKGGWKFEGSSNEEELQAILRSTIMIRRLKKDVLKDLPPKQRMVVEIPRDKRSIFTQSLKKEEPFREEIDRILSRAEKANSPSEFINIMRSFSFRNEKAADQARLDTARAKMPDVIKFIETLVADGEKVVVFAHHREITQGIHTHFGKKSRMVIGGMDDYDRQRAIDDFQQQDHVRVIVLSYMAAGVGITLTASSTVVAAELMYDPGTMDQAEDRTHRIGQTNSVNVYYCVLEQSIDAKIAEMVVKKMQVSAVVLDGEGAHDGF